MGEENLQKQSALQTCQRLNTLYLQSRLISLSPTVLHQLRMRNETQPETMKHPQPVCRKFIVVCDIPRYKLEYFEKHWESAWIKERTKALKGHWQAKYKQTPDTNADELREHPRKKRCFDTFERAHIPTASEDDELDRYLRCPLVDTEKPLTWWLAHKHEFPQLSRFAFDMLSVPAMSAEPERTFSSTKRTVTDDRNRLSAPTMEMIESMKVFWSTHLPKSEDQQ